jgi:hypothetical protein
MFLGFYVVVGTMVLERKNMTPKQIAQQVANKKSNAKRKVLVFQPPSTPIFA